MLFLAFLAMAGLLLYGGTQVSQLWLAILLHYAAVSSLAVGLVYLFSRPTWLLKRLPGSRHRLGWLLFGPFFAANGLTFHLHRLTSRQPHSHEIVPGLFLGRRMTAREAADRQPPPAAVVDLACEFAEVPAFRQCPGYLCLPALDGTTPSAQQLRTGVSHISRHLASGPVYVHCALGHGRSATLIAAFLLLTKRAETVEDAVAMIRKKRPRIGLKASQVETLRQLIDTNHD